MATTSGAPPAATSGAPPAATSGAPPAATSGAPPAAANCTTWVARLADALGIEPPTEEDVDALLGLAGIAAHASERTAAPLSTWLAGRAGLAPTEAKAVAERLAKQPDDQG